MMDKVLDETLCERYPLLFRDRHAQMTTTAMAWGFACGNGWFDLIDALCEQIELHLKASFERGERLDVRVVQVKEKFGTLRFYTMGEDAFIHGLIWMAEDLSAVLCERCGRKGRVTRTDSYAMACRCIEHGGILFASESPPFGSIEARPGVLLSLHDHPGLHHDQRQQRNRMLQPYPRLRESLDKVALRYDAFPDEAFLIQASVGRLTQDVLVNRDPDLEFELGEDPISGRPQFRWQEGVPPSFQDGKMQMAQAFLERYCSEQGKWQETLSALSGEPSSFRPDA